MTPTHKKPSRRFAAAIAASALFALAVNVAPAAAAETRVFLETFSSAAKPSFSGGISAAVDQSTGDVLVLEAGTAQISRYHSDGTPSNFSALGTNIIDGVGPGPDQTPENGLVFESAFYSQIAVDNSGTATDGNIYVTQNEYGGGLHLIDVFASNGEFLGQITGAGETGFGEGTLGQLTISPCGVAVDGSGRVYVAGWREDKIYKFDPTANPPTNGDYVTSLSTSAPCGLAVGAGPTNGSLFVTEYGGSVFKLDIASGALAYVVFPERNNDQATQVAVNSADGHVLVTTGGSNSLGIREYEASADSGALPITIFGRSQFVAVDGSTGRAYAQGNEDEGEPGRLNVYSPLLPLPDAFVAPASNVEKTSATLNGTVETFGEPVTECFFEYVTEESYEPETENPYAAGQTAPCVEGSGEIGTGTSKVHADVGGLAEETRYHYRLIAGNAYGRGDLSNDEAFQTKSKPELLGEWAEDVTVHEATLKAQINPQSAATTYRFEWGQAGVPYEHITADLAIGSEPKPQTVGLFLQGLQADTAYHYRVVAENEIGTSEGPERSFITFPPPPPPDANCPNQVLRYGDSAPLPDCRAYEMVSPIDKNGGDIVGGDEGESGAVSWVQASTNGERITYTSTASFAGQQSSIAPNQYLGKRTAGGWANEGIYPPVVGESVPGEMAFGLYRMFMAFTPDLCSAWLRDIQDPPATPDGLAGFMNNLYRRDNCGVDEGGLEALAPSYEVELPPGTPDLGIDRDSMHGVSDDGRHAVFTATAPLTDDAHPLAQLKPQIFDRFCPTVESELCQSGGSGQLALVSVLPDGSGGDPVPGDGKGFAASGATQVGAGGGGNLRNAVSLDGSRVYWSSVSFPGTFVGKIYVRLHPEQGVVSGECTKASKACTLPVSAAENASFWQASADGSKALYDEGFEGTQRPLRLFEFDLEQAIAEEPPRRLISKEALGVAGAAEDLSRIYFVAGPAFGSGDLSAGSATVENVNTKPGSAFRPGQRIEGDGIPAGTTIVSVGPSLTLSAAATASGLGVDLTAQELPTGAQENSEGDVAQIDRPNLYLEEDGALTFVATLLRADVEGFEPGSNIRAYDAAAHAPLFRASRVTRDGSHIVFETRAALTGYDNTAPDGRPVVEVFMYEAGGELICVSCNPTLGRPMGIEEMSRPYTESYGQTDGAKTYVPAAAWIPTWEHPLHASHVLAQDGSRIFFNSFDALLPRDNNGAQDVYQWEAAGTGGCELDDAQYFPQNGGCIYLISSGESSFESRYLEASADGKDVFFTTAASLLPQDPGSIDLYDARVNGGFPQPVQAAECEGEACQSPPAPPDDPTPASSAFRGAGNVKPTSKRCPKGKRRVKRKGQERCLAKKKHTKGRAGGERGAGR